MVTVIIPVYNGEEHLAKAIESALAQRYRPLEIVVVDDGSTDASLDIARSYAQVRVVHQTNQGHAAARNAGLAVRRGECVAFLDADDTWHPDKLHTQMTYLDEHPELGYVICRMQVFLEPGTEWPSWLNKDHYVRAPAGFVPSALVARQWVFEEIGGFDVSYRHGNDSDWFFKARDAGIPMGVVPQVLLFKRVHSANMSHAVDEMTSDILRVVRSSLVRRKRFHREGGL